MPGRLCQIHGFAGRMRRKKREIVSQNPGDALELQSIIARDGVPGGGDQLGAIMEESADQISRAGHLSPSKRAST